MIDESGFIMSGAYHAVDARDRAIEARQLAHRYIRRGQVGFARECLRQAIREWRHFKRMREISAERGYRWQQ